MVDFYEVIILEKRSLQVTPPTRQQLSVGHNIQLTGSPTGRRIPKRQCATPRTAGNILLQ